MVIAGAADSGNVVRDAHIAVFEGGIPHPEVQCVEILISSRHVAQSNA